MSDPRSSHIPVDGGDGDCVVCGVPVSVHHDPAYDWTDADLEEPQLQVCDGCGHSRHDKPCSAVKVLHRGSLRPSQIRCGCGEVTAA